MASNSFIPSDNPGFPEFLDFLRREACPGGEDLLGVFPEFRACLLDAAGGPGELHRRPHHLKAALRRVLHIDEHPSFINMGVLDDLFDVVDVIGLRLHGRAGRTGRASRAGRAGRAGRVGRAPSSTNTGGIERSVSFTGSEAG